MQTQPTHQLKVLKEGVHLLPKGDQGFAASLLTHYETKGHLSDKQWFWIDRLATATEAVGVPDFTKEVVHVGQFGAVLAFFEGAKKYLKFPKITLQLPDGSPLQLALAGSNSKAPGTITITDGGGFGVNKWYGRVTKEGAWEPAAKVEAKEAIAELLTKLATAPACVAAAHGKLTGNCCFCNSKLSDERSTAVGYGQTCSKRWGLVWGKKAP